MRKMIQSNQKRGREKNGARKCSESMALTQWEEKGKRNRMCVYQGGELGGRGESGERKDESGKGKT